MSAASWIKPLRHVVWASALVLAVAGQAGHAFAQDADDEDDLDNHILNTDKQLLESFLGPLGLGSSKAPEINYRERSPLVVPASRDLPPPGAKSAKAADWPLDPEVKARRKAAAESKNAKPVDPAKPISGTPEMYRVDRTGKWDESGKSDQKDPGFLELITSGRILGRENNKVEVGTFTGEPPRTSLLQPPAGYLTPSPAAPYGMTPRALDIPKKEPKL